MEHKKVDFLNSILPLELEADMDSWTNCSSEKKSFFQHTFLEFYVAGSVMAAPIFYDGFSISRQ